MNSVYIATSLDGYIADSDGGLDWLQSVPNPEHSDLGWADFMNGVDGLVMGRATFETICGFDAAWPYALPVFVLSNSLTSIPEGYEDKVEVLSGEPEKIVEKLQARGLTKLYIDGGKTVQRFLKSDLIDELIITRVPIVLGSGVSLFGDLSAPLAFEHTGTQVLLGQLVQSHYQRRRCQEVVDITHISCEIVTIAILPASSILHWTFGFAKPV